MEGASFGGKNQGFGFGCAEFEMENGGGVESGRIWSSWSSLRLETFVWELRWRDGIETTGLAVTGDERGWGRDQALGLSSWEVGKMSGSQHRRQRRDGQAGEGDPEGSTGQRLSAGSVPRS